MDLLLAAPSPGVRLLTLNRPEAMNALSRALRAALAGAIKAADEDGDVRAIVLTGAGERAFCAGLDLKEIGVSGLGDAVGDASSDPVRALGACRKPVLAAVNGVAATGGLELALACDVLLASTQARFADTHVRMGVMPGWGLSQRLSRLIGPSRAKEMSLGGGFIDAETALAWGLVNRLTAQDGLLPAVLDLAAAIAGADPRMTIQYKQLIDDGFSTSLAEGLQLERRWADDANAGLKAEDLSRNIKDVLARAPRRDR